MRAFALLVAAVVLVAGCTGTTGTPAASALITPQTAPPVPNPKDARGVAPCTLLTAAQATSLGLDAAHAEAGTTADLVDCFWPSAQQPVSSASVSLDTNASRRGLADTYLKRDTFGIFEPLVVAGYPAARTEYGPSNDCTIHVGLSDTQDMFVTAGARSPADTCGLVKQVIAAMLTNLPPQR